MAARYNPGATREAFPRIAFEAAFGVAALVMTRIMAPRLGLRVLPPESFALFLGLAHIAWGWFAAGMPTRRGNNGRIVGAALAAMLVIVPAGLWLWTAAGASVVSPVLGLLVSLVIFTVVAAAAGSAITALSLRGDGDERLALSGAFSTPPADASHEPGPVQRGPSVALATAMGPAGSWGPRPDIDIRMRDDHGGDPGSTTERGVAEQRAGWLEPERLPDDWFESSGARRESRGAAAVRRALDLTLAGGLLLGTLPLLVLTAIAIRLETPGPVFYRQERVGRDGRVFTIFKFRSMTANAEAPGQAIWAVPQDPRVTRVGRFIRLTRIDEVPQVLNVLRGEMAFIGPRPERPVFVAQLDRILPRYADRAAVKPGITGWAQVRYRYGASVDDARMKLGYDLYYIRHRSLAMDLRILAATVRVVLYQEGAR